MMRRTGWLMFSGAVPSYGYEKMVTRGGRYEFFVLAQTPSSKLYFYRRFVI